MSEDVADVNTRQVAYDAMLAVKEARDIDDTDYALADAIHDALAALSSPETTPAGVLDEAALREAIYAVSVRHDWANRVDTEDRTAEIAREYAAALGRSGSDR